MLKRRQQRAFSLEPILNGYDLKLWNLAMDNICESDRRSLAYHFARGGYKQMKSPNSAFSRSST